MKNSSTGSVQITADVAGYFLGGTPTAPGTFVALTPARVLDTRASIGAPGPVGANRTAYLGVDGVGGVPHGATAITANVTVTQPTSNGFITVYPAGGAKPTASNVNYAPSETVPNLVTVKVGGAGYVALANSSAGTVQLIADVAGYYR